ncbi:MAG: FHA domain-containing protein [Kiritimatiellia bacterium]
MTPKPHLLIESGPDQGRSLTVPEPGARIGRAHGNDFELKDPTLSRFQCRFYFADGLLYVADLGSTNQTLVNGKPVTDVALAPGDALAVGEMVIRVVNNRSASASGDSQAAPAPAPAAKPATASFPSIAPAKPATGAFGVARGADTDIDLGLASSPKTPAKPGGEPGALRKPPGWLWAAVFGIVAAAGVAITFLLLKDPPKPAGAASKPLPLEIRYEKVEANASNIFRYGMQLDADGRLRVRIDDLDQNRQIEKDKVVDAELLRELRDTLGAKGFFDLNDRYEGAPSEQHVLFDLTLVLGRNAKRVKVFNKLPPTEFTEIREILETFAQNELGLAALSLPPEQARKRAEDAWLLGNKLYAERNSPQQDNLWRAIKAFSETEWYLEALEPKPDLYAQAIQMGQTCQEELKTRFEQMQFTADRHIQLSEWDKAAKVLRTILEMIPDRTDDRHKAIQRKLLDVERRLR